MRFYVLTALLAVMGLRAQAQCPDVGATRKKVASSFHSSIMIDHTGAVKCWGESATPTAASTNVLSPLTVNPALYSGTPLAVAASSIVTGANGHQLFLLTTAGLYGWGSINSTAYSTITSIALPTTRNGSAVAITAANIEFITASGGGLAIVTKIDGSTNGEVYVRIPMSTGGGTAYDYGDGSTSGMNSAWHQVKTDAATFLNGVTRLSFSQKGLMALRQSGEVLVWGQQVWAGDVSAAGDYAFATPVTTLPAGVTPADVNIISRINYNATSVQYATQFILGTNGRIYGIGEGFRGILGQGDETDAAGSWVTVKSPDGTGFLEGIVQISSNNPYVYFNETTNQNYYSIGALNNNGQLYLWGDNSKSMIGGGGAFYTLPTMPPNFNVNDARVGYICMGGHTTIAFLQGTNRFCYIGHRTQGSMGDGTATDNTNPSYDCINTPSAYICPPPAPLGCAVASANDLLASSVNGTIVINGQPAASYWGQGSSSAEAGINVPLPRTLYEYNGIPRGVAAGGVSVSNGTQLWILSTGGIWGWGYSANTINSGVGVTGLNKLPLPAGVGNSDIAFIRASKGGIVVVTNTGEVWIKAGVGSACSASIYGDGSSALDNSWHQASTAPGVPLNGITELSFSGTAAMAVNGNTGSVYVWGNNVYTGNGAGPITADRAVQMTLHPDFSSSMLPRRAEIIQAGANGAAEFLIGSNGKLYSLGGNLNGVLGIGNTTDQAAWQLLPLTNVTKLSSNNPFPNNYYSIGALTATGSLYLWGSNANGMLGGGAVSGFTVPTIPTLSALGAGVTATDNVNGFEMGGQQTLIFTKPLAANPDNKFLFAGVNAGGAKGDVSPAPASSNYTSFAFGAGVINCAGAVYNLSGNVYYDPNGANDAGGGLISGPAINDVAGTPSIFVNLLDESGTVVNTTPVGPGGSYFFNGLPAATYTIQLATTAGALFSPAPAANLPAAWGFAGEQLGTVPGAGINRGASALTGRMAVTLADNTTNVNFGLEQRPVADAKSFTIAKNLFANAAVPPANFPVRTNYQAILQSHAAFGGYAASGAGSLSGSDAEDCPAAGSCNTGTGRSFRINTINANTELWYYNGTTATQVTAGQVIANFNRANLAIYGQAGTGTSANPLGFTYSLLDVAGVSSQAAAYSINTGSVALPVTLSTFTATARPGCATELRWTSGSETALRGYAVQHSTDGFGFVTIGNQVPSGSGSTYRFAHTDAVKGNNYYRLLLEDTDGSISFSSTAQVALNCSNRSLAASPNPTSGVLRLEGVETGDVAELFSPVGRLLMTHSCAAGASVLDLSGLPAGVYLLRLRDAAGTVLASQRVSKY